MLKNNKILLFVFVLLKYALNNTAHKTSESHKRLKSADYKTKTAINLLNGVRPVLISLGVW